jgi:tetratricopeptide (TPR) repeat protein
VHYATHQYGNALQFYQASLTIARELEDRSGQSIVLHHIANVYRAQGDTTRALDNYNQALSLYRLGGIASGEALALANRGAVYETLNRTADAIADYRASAEIFERALNEAALNTSVTTLTARGEPSWPFQRLAVLLARSGDTASSLDYAERGRALLVRIQTVRRGQHPTVSGRIVEQEISLGSLLEDAECIGSAAQRSICVPV